jgi:hypothetical protein
MMKISRMWRSGLRHSRRFNVLSVRWTYISLQVSLKKVRWYFRKPKGLNFLGGLKGSHMFLKLLSVSGGQHSSDNIEVDKVG